jgi:raffinose/stachyose/melibiose transport system permease protein
MSARSKTAMRALRAAGLVVVGLFHLVPLYVLVSMSLKSSVLGVSLWSPPTSLYLRNFENAWGKAHLLAALLNNALITACALALIVVVGSLASYPLARRPTRLNRFVSGLLVSCMVVPPLAVLVPLYKTIVDVHGLNTHWAIILILVSFQLPLCIYLYTNFIKSIPSELDEAALLDGCGNARLFIRVIFPLLKPVTSSIVILCGILLWNDYQFSVFFLQKRQVQTISVALSQFVSQYQNDISLVAAGCLIGILPLTAAYLCLQKYFIKGLADGAVKG